jgi:hypothetical protein
MATKSSPYPPSARRPVPSTGTREPGKASGTPAGSKDPAQAPPEKDDPHWAPESGDKPQPDPPR